MYHSSSHSLTSGGTTHLIRWSNFLPTCKQSLALVVRSLVVEPAHPGSSPRLGMGVCIYLDLFQDLSGAMLSVVGDVPVNSEAPVVTSSTSRSAGSVLQRCS